MGERTAASRDVERAAWKAETLASNSAVLKVETWASNWAVWKVAWMAVQTAVENRI